MQEFTELKREQQRKKDFLKRILEQNSPRKKEVVC